MTTYPHDEWRAPSMNQLLDALAQTLLEGVEGLQTAQRRTLTSKALSEGQMPGIVISKTDTQYAWRKRQGAPGAPGLIADGRSTVMLELQAYAPREGETWSGDEVREAFVHEVLRVLVNNPRLRCQLPGEAEATDHCRDFVVELPRVTTVPAPAPIVRAIMRFNNVPHTEDLDSATGGQWVKLTVDLYRNPLEDDADKRELEFDLENDFEVPE